MTSSPPKEGGHSDRNYRNVGGTEGGLGEFLLGLALLIAGGYLLLDTVMVTGSIWRSFFGISSFGLTLLPIFIGVAMLFFNGKSLFGWVLTVGGAITIFVGILTHINIFFKPTSLYYTLMMLILMAAGIGLIARSLRAHRQQQ